MAIGQRKDGTFIFVVIDGRQPGYSLGTNLLELQNIFNQYDAYNAANLDGGSSATMYYNGSVVNKTSTPIGERYLPNAIIVEK
jgi:exopolysaccharide biosynthesis protein